MGLDSVEIVMRTEEAFGIEIPDAVAQEILTPGALVAYLAATVPCTPTAACHSQQLFYKLRRGFRHQLRALTPAFDLDTPLNAILHKDRWPLAWEAVRADVGAADWPTTIPWPGLLSNGPRTIRELIWHITASLPRPDVASGEPWTRLHIEAEVRRIVGDVVGTNNYSLKDRFVEDIGID